MIVDIGHVAITTPDVDGAVRFATSVLGMAETERIDGVAYLTHASPYLTLRGHCHHHVLEIAPGPAAALDHFGLLARRGTVNDVVARASAAGATDIAPSDEPWLSDAVRLSMPSGHRIEIYEAMEQVELTYSPAGVVPMRLGHINLLTTDLEAMMTFLVDGLGLRTSDWIDYEGKPIVGFARCHFEHHTIAIAEGEAEGINHYAFELPGAAEIGQLGDCLVRHGRDFMWGPVREVAGDNIAAYFDGPGEIAIEVYSGMHRILDDAWQPRHWNAATDVSMWSADKGIQPLLDRAWPIAVPSEVS